MKTKYFQRHKVTLSLGSSHLVWMLRLECEWVSNLKSVPSNCLKINFSCCVKNLKFRTKNALFRYCGKQVEKDIAIFAISALKVESFMQNVKNFNLGPKLPSLDWHLKTIGIFEISTLEFVEMQNFRQKYKTLNSATKILHLATFGVQLG